MLIISVTKEVEREDALGPVREPVKKTKKKLKWFLNTDT